MNGEILTLIIAGAALVGGAIGWFSRQYWNLRQAKRQAAQDASNILKEKKELLDDKIAKTKDSGSKNRLVSKRDDVDAMLFAIQGQMLAHALKDANLPTEEELMADGRSHFKPQEVTPFEQETERAGTLVASLILVRDLFVLARAYYDSQQYKHAKRINDIILTLNPNNPEALNNRGVIYAHLEEEV